jgi:hypothetical protein
MVWEEEVYKWMHGMPPKFSEWLHDEYERQVGQLRIGTDLLNIGRCQGRLEIVEFINKLRDEGGQCFGTVSNSHQN